MDGAVWNVRIVCIDAAAAGPVAASVDDAESAAPHAARLSTSTNAHTTRVTAPMLRAVRMDSTTLMTIVQ
jgi:hypothetical protein